MSQKGETRKSALYNDVSVMREVLQEDQMGPGPEVKNGDNAGVMVESPYLLLNELLTEDQEMGEEGRRKRY